MPFWVKRNGKKHRKIYCSGALHDGGVNTWP